MKKETKKNLIISLVIALLFLLILEVALRSFISPSKYSYGTFIGYELPPFKVLPNTTQVHASDRSVWYNKLIVGGSEITIGDLYGVYREDPLIGYAPKENVISHNGWWQSNNIGAMARYDISNKKLQGRQRMLVFGDSFAQGSRVRQEESWPTILNSELEGVEVVNLGVDGYSLGQSFLRYQEIRNRVDHDLVVLMFIPSSSLWRDVNTRRDLVSPDWKLYRVLPRFTLEKSELKLVKYRFEGGTGIEKLRAHLRKYDRFYFCSKFEEPPFIGKSVIYKLFAKTYYRLKEKRLTNGLIKSDSEALRISIKIFKTMNNDEAKRGKEFVLIILPSHSDIKLLKSDTSYQDDWNKIASSIRALDIFCIDLTEDMQQLPENQLDKGYDGSHYGPRANRMIAKLIRKHLKL